MKYSKISTALFLSSFFTLYSASGGYTLLKNTVDSGPGPAMATQFGIPVNDTIQGYIEQLKQPINPETAGDQRYVDLLNRSNREIADFLTEENLLVTLLRFKEAALVEQNLLNYLTLAGILQGTMRVNPQNLKTVLAQVTAAKNTIFSHIKGNNRDYAPLRGTVKELESRIHGLSSGGREPHPADDSDLASHPQRRFLLVERERELEKIIKDLEEWSYEPYYEAWVKNDYTRK